MSTMTEPRAEAHTNGVEAIFSSKAVVAIAKFVIARRLSRVRVATLEQALQQQSAISRGAVSNALKVLQRAELVQIAKEGDVSICELRAHKVWAKLGELFEAERESVGRSSVGMLWLAEALAGMPRRVGFKSHPLIAEHEVPLEVVETMLAKLPEDSPAPAARRSAAPGRRR